MATGVHPGSATSEPIRASLRVRLATALLHRNPPTTQGGLRRIDKPLGLPNSGHAASPAGTVANGAPRLSSPLVGIFGDDLFEPWLSI